MRRQLVAAVRMLLILTLVLGVAYPLLVTGIAQLTMSHRANGSLVTSDGRVVGSELLGQGFDADRWFQPRPGSYDPTASGPSNLGPTNPDLLDSVTQAIASLRQRDGIVPSAPIPADAVMTSASNLDPDISPAYAALQAARVAAARGLPVQQILDLIDRQTAGRTFGFMGAPRVNVLLLNLALERLA
ncbi:MAG: potassium-transporting ATPase subunit KdpC [Actinomycetota bacterium]